MTLRDYLIATKLLTPLFNSSVKEANYNYQCRNTRYTGFFKPHFVMKMKGTFWFNNEVMKTLKEFLTEGIKVHKSLITTYCLTCDLLLCRSKAIKLEYEAGVQYYIYEGVDLMLHFGTVNT